MEDLEQQDKWFGSKGTYDRDSFQIILKNSGLKKQYFAWINLTKGVDILKGEILEDC